MGSGSDKWDEWLRANRRPVQAHHPPMYLYSRRMAEAINAFADAWDQQPWIKPTLAERIRRSWRGKTLRPLRPSYRYKKLPPGRSHGVRVDSYWHRADV